MQKNIKISHLHTLNEEEVLEMFLTYKVPYAACGHMMLLLTYMGVFAHHKYK